jgi:tetratricopeptide (TPR) repeat protein
LPSILIELGNARAQQGDLDGAVASFRELVVRAEQTGNDFNQALGYNNLAYHVLLQGEHVAARTAVEAGIALATERDLPLARTWLYSTSGEIALAEQHWDAATAALQRAVFEAERFGNTEHIIGCSVNLALAEYGRGNRTTARQMLVDVEHDASAVPEAYLHFHIAYWIAVLVPEHQATETPADVLRRAAKELRAGEFIRMQRWLTCLQGLAVLPGPAIPPAEPNA